LIDETRSKEEPALLVDAGNLMFDRPVINDSDIKDITIAKTIAQIYSLMNYDAIAVGPLDLACGYEFLNNQESFSLPWISANIYREDGSLAFQPYRTKIVKGMKVAIIGITDDHLKKPQYVTVTDGMSELATLMPQLEQTHDFIILLTTKPFKAMMQIAAIYNNMHVIVGADKRKGNINGQKKNGSIIVQTADQGKYLGILNIAWRYREWDQDIPKQLNELRRLEKAIDLQLKKLEISEKMQEDIRSNRISMLVKKKEQIVVKISQLNGEMKKTSETIPPSTFVSETIPLTPMIPQDKVIQELIRSRVD